MIAHEGLVGEHVNRMDGLDSRLRVVEQSMATLISDHERVMSALFNGDDGKTGLVAYMMQQETRARVVTQLAVDAQNKADIRNRETLRLVAIIGLVLSFLLLLLDGPAAYKAWKELHGSELQAPLLFYDAQEERA